MNLAKKLVLHAALVVGFIVVAVSPGYGQMAVTRGQIVVQPAPAWIWPYDPR